MKVQTIVSKHGFLYADFYKYLRDVEKYDIKTEGFGGNPAILDADTDRIIDGYITWLAAEEEREAKQKALEEEQRALEEKAEEEKQIELSKILITSGFSFDGYTITKYSGYISGDDAISVDRGLAVLGFGGTDVKDKLMKSLVTIRRNALHELKEAAYALGCNAIIGVDFDYLTLDPQTANFGGGTTYQPYVFGVTANGNAVVIEKNN